MKIGHIAMYVDDLEAAKNFFVKYFVGVPSALYHNNKTGFSSYFINFGDGAARLEIMNRPGLAAKGPEGLGYAHIAFNLGSRERVDELTERLAKDGFEILSGPRTTGDGYYESRVIGVEGNLIELTV